MSGFRLTTGILTAIVVTMGACAPDQETETARDPGMAAGPEATPSVTGAMLTQETIDRLKAEYAVLRSEPAPEPQPSPDANPQEVPGRVAGMVSERVLQAATGGATFYADRFEGQRTASGIPFRQNQMVAAHRSYPFGTILRVTNLNNDRSVNVRVVDRGPFGTAANRRVTMIDLSRRAATQLGFIDAGRAQVRVEVLEWGPGVQT
jgi:rare lipoprotein A